MNMAEEIKTTKELKTAIINRIKMRNQQFSELTRVKNSATIGPKSFTEFVLQELYWIQGLINSFEAGLEGKITKLQKLRENEHDVRKLWKSKDCEEALRRLLEGEGGKKGEGGDD